MVYINSFTNTKPFLLFIIPQIKPIHHKPSCCNDQKCQQQNCQDYNQLNDQQQHNVHHPSFLTSVCWSVYSKFWSWFAVPHPKFHRRFQKQITSITSIEDEKMFNQCIDEIENAAGSMNIVTRFFWALGFPMLLFLKFYLIGVGFNIQEEGFVKFLPFWLGFNYAIFFPLTCSRILQKRIDAAVNNCNEKMKKLGEERQGKIQVQVQPQSAEGYQASSLNADSTAISIPSDSSSEYSYFFSYNWISLTNISLFLAVDTQSLVSVDSQCHQQQSASIFTVNDLVEVSVDQSDEGIQVQKLASEQVIIPILKEYGNRRMVRFDENYKPVSGIHKKLIFSFCRFWLSLFNYFIPSSPSVSQIKTFPPVLSRCMSCSSFNQYCLDMKSAVTLTFSERILWIVHGIFPFLGLYFGLIQGWHFGFSNDVETMHTFMMISFFWKPALINLFIKWKVGHRLNNVMKNINNSIKIDHGSDFGFQCRQVSAIKTDIFFRQETNKVIDF